MSWQKIHEHYATQDWADRASIFANECLMYFPKGNGKILEIGAGLGQDSRFFHEKGYSVLSTDFSLDVLEKNTRKSEKMIASWTYEVLELDVSKTLPFWIGAFDVIYAHLSLHYFSKEETKNIVAELQRVLKKGWIIAALLNTYKDPEYGNGEYLEQDYFRFWSIQKRYFRKESMKEFFSPPFETILIDDQGETYKDSAKWIHNLMRFIWKKV